MSKGTLLVLIGALTLSLAGCSDDDSQANNNQNQNNNSQARCGDGVTEGFEECDDGVANSDTQPDACRTDCTRARCGDGVVDTGETCDEGRANSDRPGAPCRSTCGLPSCGDGILDPGEQCDDATANSNCEPNACRLSCALPHCGDGVLDATYDGACDGGPDQCIDCTSTCTDCDGDRYGVGNACLGEDCDDADPLIHEGCTATCDPTTCPNGCCAGTVCVLQKNQNLDYCGAGGAACVACGPTETCSDAGACESTLCGNGTTDAGEACDDGDALNGTYGYCNAYCTGPQETVRVFYTKGTSAPYALYWSYSDGTGETLLATDAYEGGVGGGKVCFCDGSSIVVMNTDGTGRSTVPNTTDVITAEPWVTEVDCSPDGGQVVYTVNEELMYTYKIYLINVDGTGKVELHGNEMMNFYYSPSWNVPEYVVFGMADYSTPLLYLLAVDSPGGSPISLTLTMAHLADAGGPSDRIAYANDSGAIVVIDDNGDNPAPLDIARDTSCDRNQRWLPGTDYLHYLKEGNLWLIKVDNTENTQLTSDGDIQSLWGSE